MRILFFAFVISLFTTSYGQDSRPVIVVELFTSEGCSSCPPADRLLSSIIKSSGEEAEIIGLSFHVDYWDYIGWKDPYANQDFTLRQRAYGRKFSLNSIYTPQMIVNGKHEFVGSNRSDLNAALVKESKLRSNIPLEVVLTSKTKKRLSFSVSSSQSNLIQLNAALVEKNLSQEVVRGENRGRKLSHDNVVRSFKTKSFDGRENHFELEIPTDLKEEDTSLVVYAQASDTWEILGAVKLSFADLK